MTFVLLITAGWLYVVFSGPGRRRARERRWNKHRLRASMNKHRQLIGDWRR